MSDLSRQTVPTAMAATANGAAPTKQNEDDEKSQAAADKAMVGDFYDQLYNHGNLAVVDRFVRPDFIQHDPQIADGRAALKAAVKNLRATNPGLRVAVHRILAQGDLVVVHNNLVLTPGTKGNAVFDIFRVQNGKIAEHWEVMQQALTST